LKLPFRDKDCVKYFEIEKSIYRRLGTHPNVFIFMMTPSHLPTKSEQGTALSDYNYNNGGTATLGGRSA
jgi:hypothetical protein